MSSTYLGFHYPLVFSTKGREGRRASASGTPPGCGVFDSVYRWCRPHSRAQPPANIWQASSLHLERRRNPGRLANFYQVSSLRRESRREALFAQRWSHLDQWSPFVPPSANFWQAFGLRRRARKLARPAFLREACVLHGDRSINPQPSTLNLP